MGQSRAAWAREMGELVAEFSATLEHTRGGHLRITLPNGQVVITSGTPGDHRTYLNTRAQVRRAARVTSTLP